MPQSGNPNQHSKTSNWSDWNAALKAQGLLTTRLEYDMQVRHESITNGRGRNLPNTTVTNTVIQLLLTFNCLFDLPLRQSIRKVERWSWRAGLEWLLLDFSRLCWRLGKLQMQPSHWPSGVAADPLARSTGGQVLSELAWKPNKDDAGNRRQWRRLPLAVVGRSWRFAAWR